MPFLYDLADCRDNGMKYIWQCDSCPRTGEGQVSYHERGYWNGPLPTEAMIPPGWSFSAAPCLYQRSPLITELEYRIRCGECVAAACDAIADELLAGAY